MYSHSAKLMFLIAGACIVTEDPSSAQSSVISAARQDTCKSSSRSGNRREARAGWVTSKQKPKDKLSCSYALLGKAPTDFLKPIVHV